MLRADQQVAAAHAVDRGFERSGGMLDQQPPFRRRRAAAGAGDGRDHARSRIAPTCPTTSGGRPRLAHDHLRRRSGRRRPARGARPAAVTAASTGSVNVVTVCVPAAVRAPVARQRGEAAHVRDDLRELLRPHLEELGGRIGPGRRRPARTRRRLVDRRRGRGVDHRELIADVLASVRGSDAPSAPAASRRHVPADRARARCRTIDATGDGRAAVRAAALKNSERRRTRSAPRAPAPAPRAPAHRPHHHRPLGVFSSRASTSCLANRRQRAGHSTGSTKPRRGIEPLQRGGRVVLPRSRRRCSRINFG